MWKCSKCGETAEVGMMISMGGSGKIPCDKCNIDMDEISGNNISDSLVRIGGNLKVGGSLHNNGKIKIFDNGTIEVSGDVINSGDITVNDPEKIKQLLIEAVRTSGDVAKLGTKILELFFIK